MNVFDNIRNFIYDDSVTSTEPNWKAKVLKAINKASLEADFWKFSLIAVDPGNNPAQWLDWDKFYELVRWVYILDSFDASKIANICFNQNDETYHPLYEVRTERKKEVKTFYGDTIFYIAWWNLTDHIKSLVLAELKDHSDYDDLSQWLENNWSPDGDYLCASFNFKVFDECWSNELTLTQTCERVVEAFREYQKEIET